EPCAIDQSMHRTPELSADGERVQRIDPHVPEREPMRIPRRHPRPVSEVTLIDAIGKASRFPRLPFGLPRRLRPLDQLFLVLPQPKGEFPWYEAIELHPAVLTIERYLLGRHIADPTHK